MPSLTIAHLLALLAGAGLGSLALAVPFQRSRQARVDLERKLQAVRESEAEARKAAQTTEQRRLSESGERDRAWDMLDTLSLPVWRRDASLRLVACNAAYVRAVEAKDAGDAVARSAELLGGGEAARQAARDLAGRAQASGSPVAERRHVVAGGQRLCMEITEAPVADGNLIGFARDVTAEEELEQTLARHIDAHRQVLGMLLSGVAIVSPDFRLNFFNSVYSEIFRLEESYLRTRPKLEELFHRARDKRTMPEHPDFAAFMKNYKRKLSNLIEPIEDLLHLPDQRTIRRVTYPYPLGGALMVYEDVTDSLAMERSYNTLLAVRQETIENLQEAVAVIGADGRLKLSNARFHELWNVPLDLAGAEPHIRELMPFAQERFALQDERWSALVERIVAQSTEPQARAGRMELADGHILDWVQVPLPDSASLFTYVDVTDSIHVERVLRERNEALEAADRLKSEFIANISYELRTPLNAINGFAEMLDAEYFGDLNERQHEYAGAIVQSARGLADLISDILDLASIEAGYMDIEPSTVRAADIVESLRELAVERAHARQQTLEVDCARDAGSLVADERRLKQALFNVLSNAIKFTPKGGGITIGAGGAGDDVRFFVTDTGPGIEGARHASVFQPFDHGATGPRPPGAGAGLGLALVKRLVELHGGSVEIESAPGQGTTVACRLPRRADAAPAAKGSETESTGT